MPVLDPITPRNRYPLFTPTPMRIIPFQEHHPSTGRLFASTHELLQLDNVSTLSLETVVGDKNDFSLQKVDPPFTDSNEEFFNEFKDKLKKLNASNSEAELCIEDFLVKSEKA
jgi:alpha-1,3-glucan synthase